MTCVLETIALWLGWNRLWWKGKPARRSWPGSRSEKSLPRAVTPKRLHTFRPCSSRVRDEHLVDSEGQAAADPRQRRGGQVPEGETGRTKATSNSQEPTSTQSEEDGTLQAAEPGRVRVPQGAPRRILTYQRSLTLTGLSSLSSKDPGGRIHPSNISLWA